MNGLPVRINKGGEKERMIGMLYPKDKLFIKRVKESKHLFKVLDAWGIDAEYFTNVLCPNNYKIKVIDSDTEIVYSIMAEKIKEKGQFYHFKKKEDDRAQILCARRFWEIKKPESKQNEIEEMARKGIFG